MLVFPNVSVDVYPGPGNLTVGAYAPLDEGRTLGIADFFFAEDTDESEAADLVAFNEQVGREDVALVESVHAGLSSGAVPHGRLLAESEQLVARFQRLVADVLEG